MNKIVITDSDKFEDIIQLYDIYIPNENDLRTKSYQINSLNQNYWVT